MRRNRVLTAGGSANAAGFSGARGWLALNQYAARAFASGAERPASRTAPRRNVNDRADGATEIVDLRPGMEDQRPELRGRQPPRGSVWLTGCVATTLRLQFRT